MKETKSTTIGTLSKATVIYGGMSQIKIWLKNPDSIINIECFFVLL
jgi:hypothetical protein